MELEFLDQSLTSDEPLSLAWLIYEVPNHPANFARARHAIQKQIEEGLLQVLYRSQTEERTLAEWEIRQVLDAKENWTAPRSEAAYFLHITKKGAELIE